MRQAIHPRAEALRSDLREGEWILHCVECGFAHEKMTAARPVCWNCGASLYLTCAPTPIRLPKIAPLQPEGHSIIHPVGRVVCYNREYQDALEKIMAGAPLDAYLAAFQK